MKDKISITLNKKILRDIDSIVDNIFIRNRSQAIEYLISKALKESKTAVILAGEGRGMPGKIKNRYALKVNHLTIIEKTIKKLSDSGFKKIFIISDREGLTNIFKILEDGALYNVKIEYVDNADTYGTASSIKLLKGKIKTTFLVLWCDIVFDPINLLELWKQHLQDKSVATLLVNSSIPYGNTEAFGHIRLEGNKIISYLEKQDNRLKPSIFFGGAFVAEPEILEYPGKSFEYDIFPRLVERRLLGGQMSSSEYLHVHTKEDLTRVRKLIK